VKRRHAIAISLLLAVAVAGGGLAATRTVGLGSSATTAATSDQAVAVKKAALDRYEASLQDALAKKPPKLPPLVAAKGGQPTPASGAAPKVIYVSAQPASAAPAGDDEYEREAGDGDEHESDEADD